MKAAKSLRAAHAGTPPPTAAIRSCEVRLEPETHSPRHNPDLKLKFMIQIPLPKHSGIRIAFDLIEG